VLCAWCQQQARPALLREVEPLDDPTETHGICDVHHGEVLRLLLVPTPGSPGVGTRAPTPPGGLPGGRDRPAAPRGPDCHDAWELEAWIGHAPATLADLAALAADIEARRERCAAVEAERRRLEAALGEAREILAAERRERAALLERRTACARLVARLVDGMLVHALQPLNEVAGHLRRPPPGSVGWAPAPHLGCARAHPIGRAPAQQRPVDSRDESA
jgi:hypothetical protein